jgi:putative transposase
MTLSGGAATVQVMYGMYQGDIRERARKIIRQSCDELGVTIVKGVLARDHVHMFLSVPPKHAISDVMRCIKGRSSRRLQRKRPV